ncbi:MAG: hypothetical protein ABEH90_02470 [Halolamina sp.]
MGWSSLRVSLRNELDDAVKVRLRIDVNGSEQVNRLVKLEGGENRELDLSVDVPYGATVHYHASLPATGDAAEAAFEASPSFWGGNKCRFEAAVTVGNEGVSIGPYCM